MYWNLSARSDDKGQEAVKELEKLGLKVSYHQLDIESQESIDNLAAYLKQKYGGLDVLINNAAVAIVVSLLEISRCHMR